MIGRKTIVRICTGKPAVANHQLVQVCGATAPMADNKDWRVFHLGRPDFATAEQFLQVIEGRVDHGCKQHREHHSPTHWVNMEAISYQ